MFTLNQAIAEFFSHCLYEKNLSAKTIRFYGIDLQQFCHYIETNEFPTEIQLIDKTHLKGYLKVLADRKPKTIKRKVATLKALFNYLEYEDHILVNPIRKIKIKIKEPLMLPKALTLEESSTMLKQVYNAIMLTDKSKYKYLEAIRNAVVIELLFATGARVSEIADLKVTALNLEAGTVTIFGKGGKQRIIQICNRDTLSTLVVYCELFKDKIKAANDFLLINRLDKKLSDQSIRFLTKSLAISVNSTKK